MQLTSGLLLVAAVTCAAAGSVENSSSPGYLRYSDYAGTPYNVSYDKRSLLVNGKRSFFASVGIHYPRFTPGQWDDVILKAKNDGYNMIQTYFFHNAHQPKLSQWPWILEGPANLTLFLQKAANAGMFVDLRIGPYVCAEWSWGGYPYDLANIDGLVSRSKSPAWEAYMKAVVLNVTREFRGFFADRGGPIALGQVENELHANQQDANKPDSYVAWCGALVEETEIKIPWGMCNGASANNTINTCNSGDCTSFIEANGQNGRVLIDQPALWTENWMGWFANWGYPRQLSWFSWQSTGQSAYKAYGILRWMARGGSHVNFYNWAGGNHFARNAGSSMVNYYYWKAPIAPDNLDQGPEREHMKRLYAAIRNVSAIVLGADAQLHKQTNVSSTQIAFVYGSSADEAVFLENQGGLTTMEWEGRTYNMSASSTSILKNGVEIFNSGDVRDNGDVHVWTATTTAPLSWMSWVDPVIVKSGEDLPPPTPAYVPWSGTALGRVVHAAAPLEQVNCSEYDSELLVYHRVVTKEEREGMGTMAAPGNHILVPLVLQTAYANAWTVFADGELVGTGWELGHHGGAFNLGRDDCTKDGGKNITLDLSSVQPGEFLLTLLSTSVGIDNGGHIDNANGAVKSTGIKGITSTASNAVMLGGVDLTTGPWVHVVGAVGEHKMVYAAGAVGVTWEPAGGGAARPMTWLTTTFDAPASVLAPADSTTELKATLNLDVTGLGRGRFFVNGMDLGRYWTKLCGGKEMCQRYYPIPFDKLKPSGNILAVLDELGPTNLSSVRLAVSENRAQ